MSVCVLERVCGVCVCLKAEVNHLSMVRKVDQYLTENVLLERE